MEHDAPPPGDRGTPGVVVRPPRLFLSALLLGLACDHFLPLPLTSPVGDAARWLIGGSMIVGGALSFTAGIRGFKRAATPVPTIEPTRALVTTGIHGWTRNPIYLGMFLIYGGIGITARGPWILILGVPLAIVMRYGVVAREEAYLERRFGDAYRGYKTRVRRWL